MGLTAWWSPRCWTGASHWGLGRALTPERTDWSRDPAPPLLCCLSHVCCWAPEEPGAGHPLLKVSSAQSPDPAAACTEPRDLPGGSSCSQDNDSDLAVPSGEGLAGFGGTQSDIFSSTPPQLGVPDLCTWGVGHSSTLISIFPEPYGNGSLPGSRPFAPLACRGPRSQVAPQTGLSFHTN